MDCEKTLQIAKFTSQFALWQFMEEKLGWAKTAYNDKEYSVQSSVSSSSSSTSRPVEGTAEMARPAAGLDEEQSLEIAKEKAEEYIFTDADRRAILYHLKAEMEAGNLRYASDEVERNANRKG